MTRQRAFIVLKAVCLCLFLGLIAVSPTAAEEDDETWDFRWKNGFKLDSPDGNFKLAFGGRINLDFTFPSADSELDSLFGPFEDTSDIRRGRLVFSGTVYERVEFKIEYDFAGGDADPTDVYVGIRDTPAGNIRVGHFFEPFSIEQHTSTKYTTFLERALPNAFSPSRNVGIMLHDTAVDRRLLWAVGVFRESDGFAFGQGDDQLNLTARIAGLPIFTDDSHRLLHLGLSFSRKDRGGDGGSVRYRQRPETPFSPRLVDTGSLAVEAVDVVALEVAFNAGSFHTQGEYMQASVDDSTLGDPSFDGYYIQAGYFLTGEHRPYILGRGGFGRIKPRSIFGKEGGRGAWEIAARYSTIDLTDGAVAGGELEDVTLALNWYLNPVTRLQLNYVTAEVVDVGDFDSLAARLQIDF